MSFKLFDTLLIRSPDSLGDILVANGLFHHFIEKANKTIIGIGDVYYEATKCLYQDFKNVEVVSANVFEQLKKENKGFLLPQPTLSETPVHYGDGTFGSVFISWDQQYYNSFDLPYSMRSKNFKMPKHIEGAKELKEKLTEGEKDYIVVNRYMGPENRFVDYMVSQFNPNNYKVVEIVPGVTNNALQYVELLKNAKQIHVLPTSFFHIAESMIEDITKDLYFHHVRRNFFCTINNRWNNYSWTVVNYPFRH
jgi:hypothetical protein